jgi:hypothetical protein
LIGSSLHFRFSSQQKEINHSAPPWESAHPIHSDIGGRTIFVLLKGRLMFSSTSQPH